MRRGNVQVVTHKNVALWPFSFCGDFVRSKIQIEIEQLGKHEWYCTNTSTGRISYVYFHMDTYSHVSTSQCS